MNKAIVFGTTLAAIAGTSAIGSLPTQAVQLADGTVYFAQPPSLVAAITTFHNPEVPATYYFTFGLPTDAGEPLQRVLIAQHQGLEDIRFNLKHSYAFVGTPTNKGQEVKLKEVTRDNKTQTVSVMFDPPVSPGQTVTVGLHAVHNPLHGGVYLFGVTAFPSGEKSHGQFLGFGRLQFTSPGGRH